MGGIQDLGLLFIFGLTKSVFSFLLWGFLKQIQEEKKSYSLVTEVLSWYAFIDIV